jgi:hypothetical protein
MTTDSDRSDFTVIVVVVVGGGGSLGSCFYIDANRNLYTYIYVYINHDIHHKSKNPNLIQPISIHSRSVYPVESHKRSLRRSSC